jgi:hypothetical protein
VHIEPAGGSFQVPRCNGWSGTINYPSTFGHKVRLIITTSTKNGFGEPAPPSGTAIFYMHVQPRDRIGGPAFDSTGVTDTVTSPRLTSDHTYTLIAYNQCVFDDGCPPIVTPLGSPQEGSNSLTFASPFNGADMSNGQPSTWQFAQN